ncbi:iron donor protein CyaY [soil metagenome]
MTESEFMMLAEHTLSYIEAALEKAADSTDLDIEWDRSGNLLEVEIISNASKIIINTQAPMQQIWVAAKSGGFHYKHEAGKWIDTRDGSELFAALSQMLSAQSGLPVHLQRE